jgi:hypothetical protein
MHDPGAEVCRENLARLGAAGDEADRASRPVRVAAQLALQLEEPRLGASPRAPDRRSRASVGDESRYMVIEDISALPRELPKIYQRVVRA